MLIYYIYILLVQAGPEGWGEKKDKYSWGRCGSSLHSCEQNEKKKTQSYCKSSVTVMTIKCQEREIAKFSGWTFDSVLW